MMRSNKPFNKSHKSQSSSSTRNSYKNKKQQQRECITELSTNTMSTAGSIVSSDHDLDEHNNHQETEMTRSLEETNQKSFNGCSANDDEAKKMNADDDDELNENDCLIDGKNNNNQDYQANLPDGWEEHEDNSGPYYWHIATGTIQRIRPSSDMSPRRESSFIFYHDDEEINQTHRIATDSSPDLDRNQSQTSSNAFIIYPLGNCEFDETQLTSASSSKAIQRCIQQISGPTSNEDNDRNALLSNARCWNLDPEKPILMRIYDRQIVFFDLDTKQLIHKQSIAAIKVWAVNDDNDFAYVVEDSGKQHQQQHDDHSTTDNDNCCSLSYEEDANNEDLLLERCSLAPNLRCYIFRSLNDDEMSSKVADILNAAMAKIKEAQIGGARHKMRDSPNYGPNDDLEVYPCDHAIIAKYLGYVNLNRPSGIDMLNNAIDKCVAEAEKLEQQLPLKDHDDSKQEENNINIDCKIHISPSSVIVESCSSGNIIVECRIRFLTFMGISKRDVKWYGFIMQTDDNRFQAHCFECQPSAGPVCEAIQLACKNMYKKVIQNLEPETIRPGKSSITSALRKTFSKIKLGAVTL